VSAVANLIRRLAETPPATPAADAYRDNRRQLADLGRASVPLTVLRDGHSRKIDAAGSARAELDALRDRILNARAAALNNEPGDDVASLERQEAALVNRLGTVSRDAAVATRALESTMARITAITTQVATLQEEGKVLLHGALREKLAQLAPAYQTAADNYLDALLEIAATASAADELQKHSGWLKASGSGWLYEVRLPSPDHPAYGDIAAPRNLTVAATQRAAEILAQFDAV
jgi:hypothetical protein